MSLGGDAGIPLWFWAFFLAFTTITQITTWGIAVYTYYTAMVLKFTAMKAGNTMTDIDKELMRWRKRLKRMGVTVDRFTPIFDEAEKEFKSLTDKERQEFFDDMREQVRKKIHELKNRDGAEVPVPEGRVIECQQSDAVTESDAGKRKPETRTPE
jgi:DNA-binding transcriptional MerR regulator